MKFIFFHGSFGSPEENWLPWLKGKLEKLGQEVAVPKFPVDDWEEVTKLGPGIAAKNQNLDKWLKAASPVASSSKGEKDVFIVAHSLGCLFALHVIQKWRMQTCGAVFVSPFLENLDTLWQIDLVNQSFWKTDFDYSILRQLIPSSNVLYGDDDPYVKAKFALDFAKRLGSKVEVVPNGGHLNEKAGFLEFPRVLELCKQGIT